MVFQSNEILSLFLLLVNNFRFLFTCAPTGRCNLDQISLTRCIRAVIYTFFFFCFTRGFFSKKKRKKPICMADKALTVSCLFFFFLFKQRVIFVVQDRFAGMWPRALQLCLRSALVLLFCPELSFKSRA